MRRKRSRGKGSAQATGDYDVGYGRPPEWCRFRPGRSGNPRGRPKGAKNAASIARAALKRRVPVVIKGVRQNMTVREVALRKLADKALTGDQRALGFLLALANEPNPADPASPDAGISDRHDLEILQEYLNRHRPKKDAPQ